MSGEYHELTKLLRKRIMERDMVQADWDIRQWLTEKAERFDCNCVGLHKKTSKEG